MHYLWNQIKSDDEGKKYRDNDLNYSQKYLRSNGGRVMMQDGTEIEVARRKKDEFLKMIAG